MGKGSAWHTDAAGIAVVGIAGRFPGADDCGQFWENLKSVTCSIREIPPERWDLDRYYSPVSQDLNKSVSKWGGFINGVDHFDAKFFDIPAREARLMDPQQRMLLELAWACVEDAGYAEERLRGSNTGVFVGVMNFDYRERLTEAIGAIAGHMSTGAYTALIPNRISHFFDWHGPSMPIDTACSSSLVALHQAVHALYRGECEQALVGGVNVLCSPTHYISFSKMGLLSPEGLCRTFDERANGYVRAEGAALLLLKRLPEAIADGDHIYGVIRGTAVNHGGKARAVTYPSFQAQAEAIATAFGQAGIPPESVGYIEAHGTGTPKGDPIEVNGLKAAFARLAEQFGSRLEPGSCGLGSLKTNVGHLEPVSGVAGIIKLLLAMAHRTLPGLAHFQQLSHRIDLSDSPFYIVSQTQDWPARLDAAGRPLPRCAGVSSFGFGGVNAHAVVEEFVAPEAARAAATTSGPASLVVISARTADRLRASAGRLLAWLQCPGRQVRLADLAYTLQVGRNAMESRLGVEAHSLDELCARLAAFVAGAPAEGLHLGEAKPAGETPPAPVADLTAGFAAEYIAQGRSGELLECWTQGAVVDWARLYSDAVFPRPCRISLPTYPFAQESHWVSANLPPADAALSAAAV